VVLSGVAEFGEAVCDSDGFFGVWELAHPWKVPECKSKRKPYFMRILTEYRSLSGANGFGAARRTGPGHRSNGLRGMLGDISSEDRFRWRFG
jgi:hypothetical protein